MLNYSAAPEGSSLHVLAAETHVDPLFKQRTEGHVLSKSPVHDAVPDHLTTTLQDPTQT